MYSTVTESSAGTSQPYSSTVRLYEYYASSASCTNTIVVARRSARARARLARAQPWYSHERPRPARGAPYCCLAARLVGCAGPVSRETYCQGFGCCCKIDFLKLVFALHQSYISKRLDVVGGSALLRAGAGEGGGGSAAKPPSPACVSKGCESERLPSMDRF